jgi:hypothetical protein
VRLPSALVHAQDGSRVGSKPRVFGRWAKYDLLQLVAPATVLAQRPGETGAALLMEIAPNVAEWKVAFGPRCGQGRPDVVPEFRLVDRQSPERRLVAGGQRLEHRARDRVRRLERLLKTRRAAGHVDGCKQDAQKQRPNAGEWARRNLQKLDYRSGHVAPTEMWVVRAAYRAAKFVQPRVQSSPGGGGTAPMKVTAWKKPSFGG